MLRELRIRDVAIIEDVSVTFGAGLNVLSGETGAGKSIILGALGLVLGGRASAEMVRTGRPSAEVQAWFDLDEPVREALRALDVEPDPDDDGLLVRRVVNANGRSRAYLSGTSVPVGSLRDVAAVLVDYASQHEHQVLLDEARHRAIVDRFGELGDRVAAVEEAVTALRSVDEALRRLESLEDDQRKRLDFVEFQLGELDSADPRAGEEEELEQERRVLGSAARLADRAREAERALYGGGAAAVDRLGVAVKALRELSETDTSLKPLLEGIEGALFAVEDAGRELASYASRTRQDPRRLQEIEDRLALLHQLSRKHRTDVDGLVTLREELRAEADELGDLDSRVDGLRARREEARAAARAACTALTDARREAGDALARAVEGELASLAMPRARLEVQVGPLPEGLELGDGRLAAQHGADAVAMLLSANPGEEPRALSRVASGGELSRILLAVRRALADSLSVQVQVCVFDEIDSGMGGATAETVADKLAEIAQGGQVLAITHLPRIAAVADTHFRVEKQVSDGRTRTDVVRLLGQDRVDEVVRMVAGTAQTEAAETFARELLGARGV